jgi:AcrR family transcriptional regulator
VPAVVRSKPADRLEQLGQAALGVFKRKGYRQARMSDVARAMGVSQGLLYTYVESKEALLHHVIERIVGADEPVAAELPLRAAPAAETAGLVERTLRQGLAVPALDAALERGARRPGRPAQGSGGPGEPAGDPRSELEAVIRQHYMGLARWRDLLALVERLALDAPEIRDRFYTGGRRPFVARLATYIERGIATGALRPVPDAAVAARLVVETVAWFAYHRHDDLDSAMIDDSLAERTVVDLLTTALVRDAS